MIATIESTNQQTMLDLCLMAYGSQDLIVKFCSDNNIDDINYTPLFPQTFLYDTSLVTDQQTSNYSYASTILENGASCPIPTALSLVFAYTTAASFSWTITSGTYQYAVTIGHADPVTWTDIDASLGTVFVEGLEESTTYTFWLRNKCSPTSFSAITHIPFETADPPSCDIPIGMSLGAGADTTQEIDWTPDATPGRKYKWVLNTTGVTPSTDIATGTFVLASLGLLNLTGLTPNTHYYFYLRSKCTDTDASAWVLIEFDTAPSCTMYTVTDPAGPPGWGITDTTATPLWVVVPGAIFYYTYNTTGDTPPNGTGIMTTSNSAALTGLTPATDYYFIIQLDCGDGSFSTYTIVPFTTLS